MPIPKLDDIRLPALQLLAKLDRMVPIRDIFELLAPHFELSEKEKSELLPSGTQPRWRNRTNWACYELFRAGLLDRPKRGYYSINDSGQSVLERGPQQLSTFYLRKNFPKYDEFLRGGTTDPTPDPPNVTTLTPEEQIDQIASSLNTNLQSELLDQLRAVDPFRFEQIVIDLLFALGYGGSREEAAKVTQRTNDEGIDGMINEDRLGLDVIYVQAKRWQANIGRKEIQSFVGALSMKQASKGVFITTSDFNHNAVECAEQVPQKIILIDGRKLAALMIEHNIGVALKKAYEIKRIDSDYFED